MAHCTVAYLHAFWFSGTARGVDQVRKVLCGEGARARRIGQRRCGQPLHLFHELRIINPQGLGEQGHDRR